MPRPPRFPGVYIVEASAGPPPIVGAPSCVTAFVGRARQGPLDTDPGSPVHVRSFAQYDRVFGGPWSASPLSQAVQQFFLNGGAEALIVRVQADAADRGPVGPAQIAGAGLRDAGRGLYALERAGHFDLLCIPPLSPDTDVDRATWDAAVAYAAERRAIVLVDPPAGAGGWRAAADVTEAALGRLLTRSANAALYFPRLLFPDPLDGGRPKASAPCGAVAGLIARTDATRGVWASPAGLEATLVGASGVEFALTDRQQSALNVFGVNALRRLAPGRTVAWGARTLLGDDASGSEWKYLAVRRLALHVEQSLWRGTPWVVFEPNGEPLWARLRLVVGDFLHGLFRQSAFQGTTPREAFFVRCDAANHTAADLAAGRVNLEIGFAPLRPGELVVLRIGLQAAGG
jgi:phage tail sheath protein FI